MTHSWFTGSNPQTLFPYVLPLGEVIWKQYRRSSHSTAMTELLSRSRTIPPATAPRGWHIRFPLREEEQPVPRRGHQPRLTAGHRAQCVKPDTSPANYTKSDPDPRKVTRTSWCWGNRLSGWGRDSRGHDGGPACRQCHPRTGALSETSAWPLPRPLTETQCWSTDREREGITDNPHTRVCVLWNKDMFFTSDSCWKLSLENCPSSSTPAPSPS